MAPVDRFTGTNLVVEWLLDGDPPGSEVRLSGAFTEFTFERTRDMADVTAGNETFRSYVPTIEEATWSIDVYDEGNTADELKLLPGSKGKLSVYPKGKTVGEPMFSFNAIIKDMNKTYPFDDKVQLSLSGSRNGPMIDEIGATVPV